MPLERNVPGETTIIRARDGRLHRGDGRARLSARAL
jgi:hypothetical protein